MSEARATVLVVDDEPSILNLITWVLQRRGYAVLVASDGRAGLELFDQREDIDVVVSDVAMPDLDGIGMVRELRRRRPSLPVVFMSGYDALDRPGLGDDSSAMLRKPFTPQQLVERIEQLLARGA